MEIRALDASDDRASFRSGDADLDRYFHKYAGQNQFRHHIGTTYVAVEDRRILGYATVAAATIELEDLSAKLKRSFPGYPLPVLRLARLATHVEARGKGLGRALLKFVFGLALRMAESYGCVGVVVDAKPDAVAFYEPFGFLRLEVVEGHSGTRPVPTALFLSIKDIRAAAG